MAEKDYAAMLRELCATSLSPENVARLSLLGKASRDHLTGLRDYRSFPIDLEERLLNPAPWILTALSIDNLRELNIVSGWIVGDIALCGLSSLLETLPNPNDFAGRVGADFMVLLNESKLNAARAWHESLRSRAAEMKLPGLELFPRGRLTLSAGYLFMPAQPMTVEDCIVGARSRMANARSRGGDCASFVDASAPPSPTSALNAIQLEVRKIEEKKWVAGTIEGLCLNGVDFSVPIPFLVREELELRVSRKGEEPFLLRGTVVWRRPKDVGALFVIGLRFAGLDPRAGEEIERILTGAD